MAQTDYQFTNTDDSKTASVYLLNGESEQWMVDVGPDSSETVQAAGNSEWVARQKSSAVKLKLYTTDGLNFTVIWPRGLPQTSGTGGGGGE